MRRLKKLTNKRSLLPSVCRQGYWLRAQLLHIKRQVNKTADVSDGGLVARPQHHWYHAVRPWRVDHKTCTFTSQTLTSPSFVGDKASTEQKLKSTFVTFNLKMRWLNGISFSVYSPGVLPFYWCRQKGGMTCIKSDDASPRLTLYDDYMCFMSSARLLQQMADRHCPGFIVTRSYGCFWFSTCLQGSGALQFPGGVPTSLRESGQQWEYPNAWPPLQHMLIDGRWQSIHVSAWEFPASWNPYRLLINQFHRLFCVSAQQCVKMHCGRCFNALFWLCTGAHGFEMEQSRLNNWSSHITWGDWNPRWRFLNVFFKESGWANVLKMFSVMDMVFAEKIFFFFTIFQWCLSIPPQWKFCIIY